MPAALRKVVNLDTTGMPTTPERQSREFDQSFSKAWKNFSGGQLVGNANDTGNRAQMMARQPEDTAGMIDDRNDPGLRPQPVQVVGGHGERMAEPELQMERDPFAGFGAMIDGDASVPWSADELQAAFAGEQAAPEAQGIGEQPVQFQQQPAPGNQVQGNIRQLVQPTPRQITTPPTAAAGQITLPPGMSLDDYNRFVRYKDHLAQLDQNVPLRQHVTSFYTGQPGPQQAPAAQPEPDGLADLDPQDRAILEKFGNGILSRVEKLVKGAVAPFEQQTQQMHAMREEQELTTAHPNWSEVVTPDELRQAKEIRPDLPVTALYRLLAWDRVNNPPPTPVPQQAAPAPVPQTRQPSAHQQVLDRLMTRTRPATMPRAESPAVQVPTNFDQSWAFTMNLLQSGRG